MPLGSRRIFVTLLYYKNITSHDIGHLGFRKTGHRKELKIQHHISLIVNGNKKTRELSTLISIPHPSKY